LGDLGTNANPTFPWLTHSFIHTFIHMFIHLIALHSSDFRGVVVHGREVRESP
jgi:hypothetical protein